MDKVFWIAVVILWGWPWVLEGRCVQGDCYQGKGKWVYPSGAVYEGTFVAGRRQGRGYLQYSNGNHYAGEFVKDQREGRGKLDLAEGGWYEGQFLRDRFHGIGAMTFPDGTHYQGQWAAGWMQGEGVMRLPDGSEYRGTFRQGRFEGIGVMGYANGDRYEGEWNAGQRHGKGTLFPKGRKAITSRWNFDRPAGSLAGEARREGTYIYQDGSRYAGTMDAGGYPEGNGVCLYADGDRYEGGWSGHRPHGEGVLYRKDGRIIHATWDQGMVSSLHRDTRPLPELIIRPDRDPASRVWAVVVGVGQYPSQPALRHTVNDARKVFRWLRAPIWQASTGDVLLLLDGEATRERILEALVKMLGRADENDIVVLYFSGHGLEGSLLPGDFDGWDNQLYFSEISELLRPCIARRKWLIADACHAGGLAAGSATESLPFPIEKTLQEEAGSTTFLLSSGPEELALEDPVLKGGIFTHYLLQGWEGAADFDKDGTIHTRELFTYVRQAVSRHSGGRQNPVLSGPMPEHTDLKPGAIFAP